MKFDFILFYSRVNVEYLILLAFDHRMHLVYSAFALDEKKIFFVKMIELIKLIKISSCFYQSDENWLYSTVPNLFMFWSFWTFDVLENLSFSQYIFSASTKVQKLQNMINFETVLYSQFLSDR